MPGAFTASPFLPRRPVQVGSRGAPITESNRFLPGEIFSGTINNDARQNDPVMG